MYWNMKHTLKKHKIKSVRLFCARIFRCALFVQFSRDIHANIRRDQSPYIVDDHRFAICMNANPVRHRWKYVWCSWSHQVSDACLFLCEHRPLIFMIQRRSICVAINVRMSNICVLKDRACMTWAKYATTCDYLLIVVEDLLLYMDIAHGWST